MHNFLKVKGNLASAAAASALSRHVSAFFSRSDDVLVVILREAILTDEFLDQLLLGGPLLVLLILVEEIANVEGGCKVLDLLNAIFLFEVLDDLI